MEQRFKPKVDGWLIGVLLLPAVFIFIASRAASSSDTHLTLVGIALLVLPLMLGAGLSLWLVLSTSYTVSAENLTVRFGPVARVIPLRSITRVSASHTIESAPAPSLDRLLIEYGVRQRVVISPKDKTGFLEALAHGGAIVSPAVAAKGAA